MSALKKLAGLASLAMVGLGAAIPAAHAQEIILYDDANYQGESLRVDRYVRNISRLGFNDRAASIRVISGTWRVCKHTDLEGDCRTISEDVPWLDGLNNHITSVQPLSRNGSGNRGGGGRDEHRGGETLTLYSGENFTGQSITLRAGERNLDHRGFNDRARSIRYSGSRSWRVCQHADFRGSCFEVREDYPRIAGGMDRQISSAEPDDTNRRGNRPITGIWLYSAPDYRGQRIDIEYEHRDFGHIRFHDHASSISIARGESWELCEHPNFRGRCETFTSDRISNLTEYGIDDIVSSARRLDRPGDRPGGRPGGGHGGGHGRIDGGTRGVDAVFFARPEINGYGVDQCLRGNGNRCGQQTADRICQATGYQRAEHFDVDRRNRARTWFLGSNRECRSGQCQPIVNVLCTR